MPNQQTPGPGSFSLLHFSWVYSNSVSIKFGQGRKLIQLSVMTTGKGGNMGMAENYQDLRAIKTKKPECKPKFTAKYLLYIYSKHDLSGTKERGDLVVAAKAGLCEGVFGFNLYTSLSIRQ